MKGATLIVIFFVLLVVGVSAYAVFHQMFIVGPVFTFRDESTRIDVKWGIYHPYDEVHLTAIVEVPVRVAIVSVEMNSSIRGLENRTLFSGGKAYWGSNIAYDPAKDDSDYEGCDFSLPGPWAWDLQENETVKVYFAIKVTYVHAVEVGSGTFENRYDTKLVTCYVLFDVNVP